MRRLGAGNPPPPKTQGEVASLFSQRYGKYVLQDESIGQVSDFTNLLMDVKNGNWAAFGNDAAMAAAQWLGMEIGGPLFAAFLQTIVSLEIDFSVPDHYPCTIQGCESAFGGMTGCSVTNEFSWDQIGANFEYTPPQGSNADFQLGPGWGTGPAGMLGWGSQWWRQTSTPDPNHPGQFLFDFNDPTMKGGPDSFEWALEQAVLTAWQQWSEPPGICDVIKQVKGDGNINRAYGGGDLANKVWTNLMARLGTIIPPMVVAWNKTHSPGTLITTVPCTQALCQERGGTWFGGGDCGSGGVPVVCTQKTPAPQREISYTVSSYSGGYANSNDPLQMAFDGLALLAGIPAGQTISVMVNSGPPTLGIHMGGPGWRPPLGLEGGATGPSALKVATYGALGVAAVTAAGIGIWAVITKQAYEEAAQRALGRLLDGARPYGELLARVPVPEIPTMPYAAERRTRRRRRR